MQLKLNPQFLISSIAILFSLSCGNDNLNTSVQRVVSQDSVGYWILKDNAQNNTIYEENLRKALSAVQEEKNDSLKANYASDLSLKFLMKKDSINFKKANKLALFSAQKIKDSSKIAAAHWDAGDFFRDYNVADSAYFHYNAAHKIYKELNKDYNSGRMLYNMSLALTTIKDYTTAETYAIEAIKIFKPLKKHDKLYSCYNHLGIVSNNLKEYQKALEYHQKALEFLKKADYNSVDEARSKNNIGSVYLAQDRYELALKEFLEVLKSDSLFFKNTKLYAKALSNAAYSRFKLKDTTEVRDLFEKAIVIKDSIRDTKALSRSYYTMAEFLLSKKDSSTALNFAKKAKKTSQASDNNLRVLETLGLLTKIDPKNATAYTSEYITLNDSLQIAERRARNKFERIRFETNETLAENELLARQKQLWTGIAATLLLLAISSFIIIDQRRKNEKLRFQEEQQASNQKIFNMLLNEKSNIEEGKKLAQKRISEELHDAVQGRIQGIRMLLLGLNKRNTPEAIEQRGLAISELQDVQEEVRAISHELSHSAYQKIYGFITTIQDLLNDVKESAGLQSLFLFNEEVDWDGFDGDVKINVYRIIQESIQNCVKHAHAKNVELTFSIQEDKVFKVVLKDDGKGFKVKNRKKGIGMRNINSRVEKLKGSWEINSTIGEGTTVILYIPIKNHEQFHKAAETIVAAS
ncbi:tetratricopeptide repeat protein [Aggregatimonas sangjinii]|uniref:histidine kinase n=1 Tax=Aggregatimonas sangjinii TaxID=2583587 RepID=A0A5B7SPW7_9FLAO|nr:tetratricopeptide repeat-containing sensor histidine kinase [Aggregatimonas sangjinii]QCX00232.1 tetratricopeptide repeat protein [Aggregatimonas sangjinii]